MSKEYPDTFLRFYFLRKVDFAEPNPAEGEKDLAKLADRGCFEYLSEAIEGTMERYQSIVTRAAQQLLPVVELVPVPGMDWAKRLIVGFKTTSTHSFFSAIGQLWHAAALRSNQKYVEHYSNGVTTFSVYLVPVDRSGINATLEEFTRNLEKLKALIAFHFILPHTPLSHLLDLPASPLTVPEVSYAFVALKFCFQFLKRYSDEYWAIAAILNAQPSGSAAAGGGGSSSATGLLNKLKTQLRSGIFTEDQIRLSLLRNPEAIRMLFEAFAARHALPASSSSPSSSAASAEAAALTSTPTKARLAESGAQDAMDRAVATYIKTVVEDESDRTILDCIRLFNAKVLKTNFFKSEKTALSFRLDPTFLSVKERPVIPFAVFFLVGSDFVGFHVRFADIARGGIRIIRSSTAEEYTRNASTLFDENYGLAMTQQAKNKDIPEGGSKGTILLSAGAQGSRAFIAFQKYIDALLDLLLPSAEVVDFYGKPEILFLGPDEGSADFMEWAALHAKRRGASFWRAFTTGKPLSLGGIPHDHFGMTTKGVHTYTLALLADRGLDEASLTKLQTGGPDGDLGSNEIKCSRAKTTSIVDGSGVLHDPAGIDHAELARLAGLRATIASFDASKLGPGGFKLLITDHGPITLPSGEVVENPVNYRNLFHLNPLAQATLFVPCGGRPAAVNASNVGELIGKADGVPRFKYIVEGANLFFTQEARLALEAAGVVLIKDAAANKGGVTSSSLEVLAALSLSDSEFAEHMAVSDPAHPPKFYDAYVKDILRIIERNALLEYKCLEAEHKKSGLPRSVLVDSISSAINDLSSTLDSSELWENESLRVKVLEVACPPSLLALVPARELLKRVPQAYIRSIFGSYLASTFVYSYGINPSPLAFVQFLFQFAGIKL